MRLIVRFVLPLVIVMALVAYAVVPVVDHLTYRWFVRDLDTRSKLIATSVQDQLANLIQTNKPEKVIHYFETLIQDERLYAVGFCDMNNGVRFKTRTLPNNIDCADPSFFQNTPAKIVAEPDGPLHVAFFPVMSGGQMLGKLVLAHDMSFIERRTADSRHYIFAFFVALSLLISLITVIVAYLSERGLVTGIRALLRGESPLKMNQIKSPELRPLAKDLRHLVRDLERERRTKDESQITWTPQSLKTILHEDLAGDQVLIVSNREPYIHVKKGDKIEVQFPASGLVTALEPIMRACSGTWIAHGGGSADKETVDRHDRVPAPPDNPSYQIRRVWLTKEEEAGYYYGFSNEGLWPLCHIAHTRPTFRSSDWDHYVEVNQKFARAVIEEAKTEDPVILVQDYHFALLPKMIRDELPKATIITFWHIPWPNSESFGICPWREEILEGLLGSSILGFHTQFHCNNFIESVDRFLEARVDREDSTISYGGKLTSIQNYPISIEWPPSWLKDQLSVLECRAKVRSENGMNADRLVGIGVDRLDYTKGILERFSAVERLLELHPEWIGKFTFVQIAAPSRTGIEQYQNFEKQVRARALQINEKYGKEGYEPICLKVEHHGPKAVFEYYRGSEVCLVTSLHDGMNLVAKEFVASRDDEKGVLILSQFTGASRELLEALVVNPYNSDQCAEALHIALQMSPQEQQDRMRALRSLIREFNVYRWAGRMLIDAARMRSRQKLMGKIKKRNRLLRRDTST